MCVASESYYSPNVIFGSTGHVACLGVKRKVGKPEGKSTWMTYIWGHILQWLVRKRDGAKQGQVAGCLERSIEPFNFMNCRYLLTRWRTVGFSGWTAACIWLVVICRFCRYGLLLLLWSVRLLNAVSLYHCTDCSNLMTLKCTSVKTIVAAAVLQHREKKNTCDVCTENDKKSFQLVMVQWPTCWPVYLHVCLACSHTQAGLQICANIHVCTTSSRSEGGAVE